MKQLLLLFVFMSSLIVNGQDIDLYHKKHNDNYELPKIDKAMTYQEFELLSQDMRVKDMLYAGVVPGYIHFKVNEHKTAYWLIGLRAASYITVYTVYNSGKYNLINLDINDLSDEEVRTKKQLENALYAGFSTMILTYFYDVIHGESVLHRKQEKIRYKYTIKAAEHSVGFIETTHYPAISLAIQF